MFASLVPRASTSEMFGFYSVSEKLAGVVGPILFGVVTHLTHGGREATVTLLPLFLGGAWMLSSVNLHRVRAVANPATEAHAAKPPVDSTRYGVVYSLW